MKILLINGYQKHDFCKGDLNSSLHNIMLNFLRHKNDLKLSSVENYNVIDERNKFLWADLIIFQFPIYWFNVPGKLKVYMDEVFEYGQFYSFSDVYGQGGLMNGKEYILSTTWNAPKQVFNNSTSFFNGKDVDDVLISFHKAMEFCGFKKRETLSFHNVVKNPQFDSYKKKLEKYLSKHFQDDVKEL